MNTKLGKNQAIEFYTSLFDLCTIIGLRFLKVISPDTEGSMLMSVPVTINTYLKTKKACKEKGLSFFSDVYLVYIPKNEPWWDKTTVKKDHPEIIWVDDVE